MAQKKLEKRVSKLEKGCPKIEKGCPKGVQNLQKRCPKTLKRLVICLKTGLEKSLFQHLKDLPPLKGKVHEKMKFSQNEVFCNKICPLLRPQKLRFLNSWQLVQMAAFPALTQDTLDCWHHGCSQRCPTGELPMSCHRHHACNSPWHCSHH